MPGVIIIGVGPGIGSSVARRFARAGYSVGLLARSEATVDSSRAALACTGAKVRGVTADAGDEAGLRAALDELVSELGVPEVLVYNAAIVQWDALGELTAAQHREAWSVNVVGAITAAAHLLPRMAETGGGTYLITGGMPVPVVGVTSLSLGKAGVRALTELLAAQFGPQGVHVATVTVAGAVAGRFGSEAAFDPEDIAERYWELHAQPAGAWEREAVYDGVAAGAC